VNKFPGHKHVPSSAPGQGPVSAVGRLNKHREAEQGPTTTDSSSTPPGGWPETVGDNPNPPAERLASQDQGVEVTGGEPGVSSWATAFPPVGGNY
jgi:hypothetical protein